MQLALKNDGHFGYTDTLTQYAIVSTSFQLESIQYGHLNRTGVKFKGKANIVLFTCITLRYSMFLLHSKSKLPTV